MEPGSWASTVRNRPFVWYRFWTFGNPNGPSLLYYYSIGQLVMGFFRRKRIVSIEMINVRVLEP